MKPPNSPHSDNIVNLLQLARGLEKAYELFQQTGDPQLLEIALKDFAAAHPDEHLLELHLLARAQLLNGAGMLLQSRYQLYGQIKDLNAAITYFIKILDWLQDSPKAHASVLSNISSALQLRFSHTGDERDIHKSVEAARMAVEATSAEKEERPSYLSNFASALHSRYLSTGVQEDLDRAIFAMRESISLTPSGSTRRYLRLNNLAALCHERFNGVGELSDLYEAIESYRESACNTSLRSTEFAALMNNLGSCLHDLYRRTGDREHLQEGIALLEKAIDQESTATPNRAGFLSNLGTALSTLYQASKEIDALQKAIIAQREAVLLIDSSSPYAASFYTGLGTSLTEYHLHDKSEVSGLEAVKACETALNLTNPNSPKWASRCNNLARALMERHHSFGQQIDLTAGQEKYQEACIKGLEFQSEIVLVAGYQWGQWALERESWIEASQAFGYALSAIKDLFERQLLRNDQAIWLRDAQVIPALAAFAEACQGNLEKAIEILENGRARFFFQALKEKDNPVINLTETDEDLLKLYQAVVTEFETLQNDRVLQTSAIRERMRTLRNKQIELYHEITGRKGGDDFLAERQWDSLQKFWQKQTELDAAIYIVPTPYRSFALIISGSGIDVIWLEFTNMDLDHWMLGDDVHPENGFLGGIMGFFDLKPGLEKILSWCGAYISLPIAKYLLVNNIKHLTMIPTGHLALLPLHAASFFLDGEEKNWGDNFSTSYAPSLYALQHAWSQKNIVAENLKPTFSGIAIMGETNPLRFVDAEVQAIAQLFDKASIISGMASTESVLKVIDQSAYVHFACHAFFDPINPWESGFDLEQGAVLRLKELFTQSFVGKRLAVLSACKTAVIDFTKLPEESIGMPIAFLQAGVPGVIGTLWSVDDISTTLLMVRFYENFLFGNKEEYLDPGLPQESLRNAQNWLHSLTEVQIDNLIFDKFHDLRGYARLRTHKTFEHPYHWAGFVFVGV